MNHKISALFIAIILISSLSGCTSMALDAIVKNYNKTCPQKLEEGLSLLKVSREPQAICFHVNIDENIYIFEAIESDSVALKSAFVEQFKENMKTDPDIAILVEDCRSEELMIQYEFVGQQSHKKFCINIDNALLKE